MQNKLKALIHTSNAVLFKAKAVFPLDFFPDSITIDENKITFVRAFFWGSQQVHSYLIKCVKDVLIETNPFFATLKMKIERYTEKAVQESIKYLKKEDTYKAQQLIQGLMVSMKEGIEVNEVEPRPLEKKATTLGTPRAAL